MEGKGIKKTIKTIAWFIIVIMFIAAITFWLIDHDRKVLAKQEEARTAREAEIAERKALEEEKHQARIREASMYTHPPKGLSYEYLGYTQMGQPHEVIKLNAGARYDNEAKWYFEDEQYKYYCGAYLYNIHRGGTYIASPEYYVKHFRVTGVIKGTNYRRFYTEGYFKDVNDFETGKYS